MATPQPQQKGNPVAGCSCLAILAIALIIGGVFLFTTVFGGSGSKPKAAAASSTPTAPAASPSTTPSAKKSGSWGGPGDACQPGPDLLSWTKSPGQQPTVQALGSYDSAACSKVGKQATVDMLRDTFPGAQGYGSGYCTIAAYAKDNPGYEDKWVNGDATTAPPRPKRPVLVLGDC